MQYETNMHAKVLCFLLVVASASAAALPQLDPKRIGAALLPAVTERLARLKSNASSPSVEAFTTAYGSNSSSSSFSAATNDGLINNSLRNFTVSANVDLSKINQSLLRIPELPSINTLPNIPGLRESIENARNSVLRMLNAGVDLQSALLNSTLNAIRSLNPVESLTNLLNNVLRVYYQIARSNPIYIVTTLVIQEGIRLVTSIINAVMGLLSNGTLDISRFG